MNCENKRKAPKNPKSCLFLQKLIGACVMPKHNCTQIFFVWHLLHKCSVCNFLQKDTRRCNESFFSGNTSSAHMFSYFWYLFPSLLKMTQGLFFWGRHFLLGNDTSTLRWEETDQQMSEDSPLPSSLSIPHFSRCFFPTLGLSPAHITREYVGDWNVRQSRKKEKNELLQKRRKTTCVLM